MLTSSEQIEIQELQRECEAADLIKLKLNWEMLRNRRGNESNDFLHYEDGKLAAFLGVYHFGNKVEICGMVKPEYRRKGIFSNLMNASLASCKERKVREILLNAPANSEAAKGFLKTIPSEFSISEYQMKWSETEAAYDESVTLRPSAPEDLAVEIMLDVKCFGLLEQEAADHYQSIKREEDQDFHMIEYKNKTVGKMRVSHSNQEAWIYGFAILPEYQGKGIGRKALKNVIRKEHGNGYSIFLEVEAKNAHALKLYESCGFKAFHVQDYYLYTGN
ncbi:GNAT family N-acetyltransferase [Bacillus sp. UMB0893]|uniref:GNAT family N-acetyltransferase n=3 Tax=Bacillaceae TaxID=186817 RepID=UPI000C7565F6|nr:GNAT family N-acetyltransferase [Bacillus sp. UMB0893]PLR69052.1 N-acetyltransferase [Bacillus sp. UMB0893]